MQGNTAAVDALLTHPNTDTNKADEDGATPIHEAVHDMNTLLQHC